MQKKELFKNFNYQKGIENAKIPFKKQIKISFFLNLVLIVLSLVLILKLPPQIPLLYGLPEGEEQLTPNWAIIIPNSIALILTIINSILANYSKDEYLKKITIISSFVVTFFALITVFKIFFLVGNI